MTNTKSTKRALLVSVMAMVICFTMLLGTTFAWFTDSEQSRNNIIVSGNLDVAFQYSTNFTTWNDLSDTTKIFDETALWEPGYTEVVYLKVENIGTLDLIYRLGMNIVDETGSTNVNGTTFELSDFIKYAIVPATGAFANRTEAIAAAAGATTLKTEYDQSYTQKVTDDAQFFALIVYMPTDVDNNANYDKNDGAIQPKITLGVKVTATQMASETDDFGTSDYDNGAEGDLADPNA